MLDLNSKVFLSIHNLSGKKKILDYFMIFGAEAIIYIAGIIVAIFAFTQKGIFTQAVITIGISIPISLILILLLHVFIKEKRPFLRFRFIPLVTFYRNLSFPSTHTTVMTIITLSSLIYQTSLSPFLIFCLIYLALSRIYIGVHYPVDILGGFATGVFSIALALIFKMFFS